MVDAGRCEAPGAAGECVMTAIEGLNVDSDLGITHAEITELARDRRTQREGGLPPGAGQGLGLGPRLRPGVVEGSLGLLDRVLYVVEERQLALERLASLGQVVE